VSEARARDTFAVVSPVSGETLADVEICSRADVEAAVGYAREAQAAWAALGFKQRGTMMRRFRDALLDRRDEIAETLSAETGKPLADAFAIELAYVCDGIGFWSKNAARFLADRRLRPHLLVAKAAYTTYKPRGVIGMITPWNYPLSLSIGEAIPALLAGNAVVLKPASLTPLVAVLCAEIAEEAGLPASLLSVVTGPGRTGSDLVDFVDMVSFTGSVEVGREIYARCAARFVPASLELGGKDPMIVCADADLERAANGCVWGALSNAGQACTSIERVYCDRRVYDDFVSRVAAKAAAVRIGTPQEEADIGCMTSAAQLSIVEEHVRDALARGARALVGGKRSVEREGNFFEPTVLVDVNHEMRVMTEETFGPVIAIQKVDGEAEAIRLANDSRYGLSASVWSKDTAGAMNIARRLQAGGVCVNDHMIHMMIPEVAMGGVKESGVGMRHGPGGIRKYCCEQTIVVDRFGLAREPVWYPTPAGRAHLYRRALNVLFRSGLRNKLFR
jgi:acyl-CoA reductase-like NAD-dependent aldehyde dehydrogenase